MKLRRKAAAIAVAGGMMFAGLAGPAYADTGSCTGVGGQRIAHPEHFCKGFTVPSVNPSASDDKVKTVGVCVLDFAIGTRLGGFGWPGLGMSAEECARNVILGW
jgi:hypothetical protein